MQILIVLILFIFLSVGSVIISSGINFYIIPNLFPNTHFTVNYIIVLLFVLFCYYLYVQFSTRETARFAKFRDKFYK